MIHLCPDGLTSSLRSWQPSVDSWKKVAELGRLEESIGTTSIELTQDDLKSIDQAVARINVAGDRCRKNWRRERGCSQTETSSGCRAVLETSGHLVARIVRQTEHAGLIDHIRLRVRNHVRVVGRCAPPPVAYAMNNCAGVPLDRVPSGR